MLGSSSASKFENTFAAAKPGHAIISNRDERFDFEHSMFFSPMRYDEEIIVRNKKIVPPADWVEAEFLNFVRVEFPSGQAQEAELASLARITDGDSCEFRRVATALRDSLERRLVFGDVISEIVQGIDVFAARERLHRLLCSEEFGNKANFTNVPYDPHGLMFSNIHAGFRCLVPGLPFRDQNAFRTEDDPGHVTMAEAYFLCRLHCTALAVYQVLPTGSDIVVLSDGQLYAPIFDVEPGAARRYFESIRQLRTDLNMAGTVGIIDMMDVVEKYDAGTGEFETCTNGIERSLRGLLSSTSANDTLKEGYVSLELGIRRNFSSRGRNLETAKLREWVGAIKSDLEGMPTSEDIYERALRYAAINLALRWLNVVGSVFPTAVRGTMHPKQGQLGLPRMGTVFPWNGVAVLPSDAVGLEEMRIMPLDQAQVKYNHLSRIKTATGRIAYYQEEGE